MFVNHKQKQKDSQYLNKQKEKKTRNIEEEYGGLIKGQRANNIKLKKKIALMY